MSKLTLPIEEGKKYIRRDGLVTIPTAARHDTLVLIDGTTHVFIKSGRAHTYPDFNYPYDLIADYIEPASAHKAHKHAALMAQYAEDAAETDTPWVRWEIGHVLPDTKFSPLLTHPKWDVRIKYRRKPPEPVFININGYQVPEPMRVPPAIGSEYWYVHITISNGSCSCYWAYDKTDKEFFNNGICHTTKEAAELHAKALLSFTVTKI